MRVIGLTGSIACGKSTVSQELRRLGCTVIDGDQLSRGLTGPGGAAIPLIREAFGPSFFQPDGSLNRRALGNLVFSDPEALQRLDNLMAPLLVQATRDQLSKARTEGQKLCFLDFPLLYEKGYDQLCDSVWCVWLPEEKQLERLMERDGFAREEALSRIHAVLSSDQKAARADVVIDNSGAVEDTLKQIPGLLEKELSRVPARRRRSERYENPPAQAAAPALSPAEDPLETLSEDAPDTLERPAAARKKAARRRASWRMPSWLAALLITSCALLAVSFTAQGLMRAWLHRQAEQRAAEQAAIDRNYPLLYRDLITEYAEEYNLRPAFVAAIIRNESSFRPEAESSVGARGLMQLMPATAEWIAHKLKVEGYAFERMYDPASNIRFGCWYLNYLSGLFRGDPVCVVCAYHAGQSEIASWLSDRAISDDGLTMALDRLPEGPTKTYAERVTRDDGIYEKKYFTPDPSDADVLPGDHA